MQLKLTLLALASSVFASVLHSRAETGIAYYGFENSTMTACGIYSNDTDFIVGLSTDYVNWEQRDNCFRNVTVSLTDDPSTSVEVMVTDACKDCGDSANIYLSVAAFQALGNLTVGRLNVTWDFVN
ncbi:RlpA-like double-psi beta-barrel-protein domain-containing protein-containing protein [Desarmillaria tabescens]|uniref:RlpA-like double-psi beta-barrel-protein domain-containing protein-containing protein n=1 Tax=Armillaria tabescens TaxID=1929756 RepID=A0AA39NDN5_ARMTA|nr:RlpA-like double-psi beta-barrel-protein domain-containing protein-containing protein [Desarmillaria tabescens]KAK0463704.1 RlpA-like double-psi beta-barrel-protein domain-containing protein-containing protein [Desarmillaria tabescens]